MGDDALADDLSGHDLRVDARPTDAARQPRSPVSLTFVEPALRWRGSHHLSVVRSVAQAGARRGIVVRAVTDERLEPEVERDLRQVGIEVFRVFRSDWLHRIPPRVLRWGASTAEMAWGARHFLAAAEPDEVFCTYSGGVDQLLGALLATATVRRPVPWVFQLFGWGFSQYTGRFPDFAQRLTARIFRQASKQRRPIVAAQTAPIARAVSEAVGWEVPALPMALEWDDSTRASPPSLSKPPVVGFLGTARKDKGFVHFLGAMEILLQERAEFLVEAQAVFRHSTRVEAPRARLDALRQRPGVILYEQLLSAEDYQALSRRLDVIVLPYDPVAFAARSSEIFARAVGMAKITVSPRDTWMGTMAKEEGIGVAYGPYTPEGLADGIREALAQRSTLHDRLRAFAPKWRSAHCAEGFLDRVLELVGVDPGGKQ